MNLEGFKSAGHGLCGQGPEGAYRLSTPAREPDMGASINRGPQNRPKYIMVLIIGATKMGPLICGNSHIGS